VHSLQHLQHLPLFCAVQPVNDHDHSSIERFYANHYRTEGI
jgi:hypothetical protein